MKYLIGTFVGLLLVGLGFALGTIRERAELEETVAAAKFAYEERTATDEYNSRVLDRYIKGEITEEEADYLMLESQRKTTFVDFTRMKGTITFGVYDPTQDPHATPRFGSKSCVTWAGENNYNCGESNSSRVKCVIFVIRETGPMAGTTFYAKKCDGFPISKRSIDPMADGYIITYDDSLFIPKGG